MTFTIGRFDLTNYGEAIKSVSEDGGKVSINGSTGITTSDQANVLRQQLLGYMNNPDEAFVPFVWADQPELNGYYTVSGAGFEEAATGSAIEGVWNFDVDLERVQNFAAPLIEVSTVAALRTNSVSVTSPSVITKMGLPNDAQAIVDTGNQFMRVIDHYNTGATGGSAIFTLLGYGQNAIQYSCPPASFYQGAASVFLGSNLIVGRYAGVNPSQSITLSNGSFEIQFLQSASTFQFQTRVWTGSAWTPYQTYTLQESASGGPFVFPSAITFTVMRNSPEQVTVRIRTNGTTGIGQMILDVGLKRGDYHATFNTTLDAGNLQIVTANATGGAATGSYGYYVAVTSGHAYFASPVQFNTGTNFALFNLGQLWQFAIGYRPSANGTETAGYSIQSYFYASSNRQSAVAS